MHVHLLLPVSQKGKLPDNGHTGSLINILIDNIVNIATKDAYSCSEDYEPKL